MMFYSVVADYCRVTLRNAATMNPCAKHEDMGETAFSSTGDIQNHSIILLYCIFSFYALAKSPC